MLQLFADMPLAELKSVTVSSRRESKLPSRVLSLKSTNSNLPVISKPRLITATSIAPDSPESSAPSKINTDFKISREQLQRNKPTRKLSLHLQTNLLPSKVRRTDSVSSINHGKLEEIPARAGAQTHTPEVYHLTLNFLLL